MFYILLVPRNILGGYPSKAQESNIKDIVFGDHDIQHSDKEGAGYAWNQEDSAQATEGIPEGLLLPFAGKSHEVLSETGKIPVESSSRFETYSPFDSDFGNVGFEGQPSASFEGITNSVGASETMDTAGYTASINPSGGEEVSLNEKQAATAGLVGAGALNRALDSATTTSNKVNGYNTEEVSVNEKQASKTGLFGSGALNRALDSVASNKVDNIKGRGQLDFGGSEVSLPDHGGSVNPLQVGLGGFGLNAIENNEQLKSEFNSVLSQMLKGKGVGAASSNSLNEKLLGLNNNVDVHQLVLGGKSNAVTDIRNVKGMIFFII